MVKKLTFTLILLAVIVLSGCNNDSSTDLTKCKTYYDGCNTCQVEEGKITICTEMACYEYEKPKCLERI